MLKANQRYVIGVDGGGSKTAVILSDLDGRILVKYQDGSSHPRNIGTKNAIRNLARAIEKVLGKIRGDKKILATFLGLPATEEELKFKKNVLRKELFRYKEIRPIFKGKLTIGSDQLAGFKSGTDEKEGVVLIAGSGCVAHGWRKNRELKVDGWGYFSEMGSAFWVGRRALQAVWKELDGRGPKTLITRLFFRELKIRNRENLVDRVYSGNPFRVILSLSVLVDKASKKGDKTAKDIVKKAGEELALSANTVIKNLSFQKVKFPLVLIGGMFKSKIVSDTVKKEIKKCAPKVNFVRPKVEPVMGAVKLATESLSDEKN